MALLELKNLKTFFATKRGTVKAVNGVSYSLDAGKVLGVVGESGSGKSVSAMSILRLLDGNGYIDSGEILFNGVDLTKLSINEMYKIRGNEISVIFQEPMTSLNPVFRIGAQVDEVIALHNPTWTKEQVKKHTISMLELVGIANSEGVYKMYPHELSGGQLQRVCIARAVACKPEIILFDEAISSLDAHTQVQVMDLLRELKDRLGLTYIFITHDLTSITYLCDDVLFLYQGRVTEHLPVERISETKDEYARKLLESIVVFDTEESA